MNPILQGIALFGAAFLMAALSALIVGIVEVLKWSDESSY